MLFIVTNQTDATTDFLIQKLIVKGYEFFRFNTDEFFMNGKFSYQIDNHHVKGVLCDGYRELNTNDIKSVWWRRPGNYKAHSNLTSDFAKKFAENQIVEVSNWLYQSLNCLWISHPNCIKKANSKIEQLKVAKKLGFSIPNTIITNNEKVLLDFFESNKGEIIIKAPLNQTILDNDTYYGFYTSEITKEHLKEINSLKYAPAIFQQKIEKFLELRISVVGKDVFCAEIDSKELTYGQLDWRRDPNQNWKPHTLNKFISEKCTEMVRHFGLEFGAIDMIITPEKEYVFLEINPNGQWAWLEEEAGLPISEALIKIFYHLN